jgi:hypothetical protein
MSRRWLLRAVLLLSVVLVGALAVPVVHWRLWGWLRGESFYRGRPTSYWSREAADWCMDHDWGCIPGLRRHTLPDVLGYDRTDRLERCLHIPPRQGEAAEVLWAGDEAAVPVLIELLKDEDSDVRGEAARALGRAGPRARGAIPALVELVSDGQVNEVSVHELAAEALGRMGRDARAAVPALLALSRDEREHVSVRHNAAEALKQIDPQAAADAGVP